MSHANDIELICSARHGDPFAVLGPHASGKGKMAIRGFFPTAKSVHVLERSSGAALGSMKKLHPDGFFELKLNATTSPSYRLDVVWDSGVSTVLEDPYRFGPVLGEMDVWLPTCGPMKFWVPTSASTMVSKVRALPYGLPMRLPSAL